jgi:hypothetical protein
MMTFSLNVAIVLGVLATGGPQHERNGSIELPSVVGGKMYELSLDDAELLKSPIWKADAPNPPVSASQAVREATKSLKTLVKGVRELENRKWELGSLDLCTSLDRWFWAVNFEPTAGDAKSAANPGEGLRIVVLMDGRVVAPVVKSGKN